MPRLLKSETARRLHVGQRALSTAFALLATPKSVSHEPSKSDGAIEMGLIGIAAELAISACLYEILGLNAIIRKETGFYITAGEALARFREILASGIPRLSLLTQGIGGAADHLKALDAACASFKVLFTSRAAAVHAGQGVSGDVVYIVGKDVAGFFELLALSPKWKPYLKDVPAVPSPPKERTIIAQELAAATKGMDKASVGNALASIFLVLPDLSQEAPEWLSALQHVHVSAKPHDISILLKTLQSAKVGDLVKVGKGASGIAAKIDPNNPDAVPFYLGGMKKKFDNPADMWGAYVGTANAQLDQGVLSLPPIPALYTFSALGIGGIGLPPEEIAAGVTAHASWPFIASALSYNGTKGPCFFLARALKADESGQLTALLKKAGTKSKVLANALKDYLPLIEAAAAKQSAPANSALAATLSKNGEIRDENRENLDYLLARRREDADPARHAAYDDLIATFKQTDSAGACILAVVDGTVNLGPDKLPLLRALIHAISDPEDVGSLVRLIGDSSITGCASMARKAIADIDYMLYGPQPAKIAKKK